MPEKVRSPLAGIWLIGPRFKGAQAWDIRSLGFSWILHHKVFMGRWFVGKNINLLFFIFERAKPHLVSDAHAEHTRKELMRHTHQGLTRMLSMRTSSLRVCSAWFVGTSITYGRYENGKLMRMLSIRISSWRVCSECAPVPCAYAQLAHQFLMRMLSIRIKAGA
jgi:hypothetical protein